MSGGTVLNIARRALVSRNEVENTFRTTPRAGSGKRMLFTTEDAEDTEEKQGFTTKDTKVHQGFKELHHKGHPSTTLRGSSGKRTLSPQRHRGHRGKTRFYHKGNKGPPRIQRASPQRTLFDSAQGRLRKTNALHHRGRRGHRGRTRFYHKGRRRHRGRTRFYHKGHKGPPRIRRASPQRTPFDYAQGRLRKTNAFTTEAQRTQRKNKSCSPV